MTLLMQFSNVKKQHGSPVKFNLLFRLIVKINKHMELDKWTSDNVNNIEKWINKLNEQLLVPSSLAT